MPIRWTGSWLDLVIVVAAGGVRPGGGQSAALLAAGLGGLRRRDLPA